MKFLYNYFSSSTVKYRILILSLSMILASCKKIVEPGTPSTKVDLASVFKSDAAAISLMNGIYVRSEGIASGFSNLSAYAGLSADELNHPVNSANSALTYYYQNALTSAGGGTNFVAFWAEFYQYIYTANEILEGVNGPNNLSDPVKTRLTGEARFIRAYFYFNLVNLFGGVPLITSTGYAGNVTLARTPADAIYMQIIEDLKAAQSLLGSNYTTADLKTTSTDRLRPNQFAATAMLARVYLFSGDYANAIAQSSVVINQSNTYTLESLGNVFLNTSKETILAFQPVTLTQNTNQGNQFILVAAPTSTSAVTLSDYVYNAFENGDGRKTSWVGNFVSTGSSPATYHYAYKYKVRNTGAASVPLTENDVILRLGEQYLIRAEAYIQTGQVSLGIADLNMLRTRARAAASVGNPNPLPALSASLSAQAAIAAVEHERQVEMFTEYADRWFTLKRLKGFTNPGGSRADEVMPAVTKNKGGTWSTNCQLYPLPKTEIIADQNLIQNPGYN